MDLLAAIGAALLSGGLIGGGVSFLVARMTIGWERAKYNQSVKQEHAIWLREQRYEAYSALLAIASEFCVRWGTMEPDRLSTIYKEMAVARSRAIAISDEDITKVIVLATNVIFVAERGAFSDEAKQNGAFQALADLEDVISLAMRSAVETEALSKKKELPQGGSNVDQ